MLIKQIVQTAMLKDIKHTHDNSVKNKIYLKLFITNVDVKTCVVRCSVGSAHAVLSGARTHSWTRVRDVCCSSVFFCLSCLVLSEYFISLLALSCVWEDYICEDDMMTSTVYFSRLLILLRFNIFQHGNQFWIF